MRAHSVPLEEDMSGLTHFDAAGHAHMVDVGDKQETRRIAIARGTIRMLPATFALIRDGKAKKGDVLGVARIAAIQGAKRTADLIPLCHPLALTRGRRVRTRRRVAGRPLRRAGRDVRPDRCRDGSADGRTGRAADRLRHVQGRRSRDGDHRRERAGEARREVGDWKAEDVAG